MTKTVNSEILQIVSNIHFSCYQLCKDILGTYFSNAGNVGIFCQSDEEYRSFLKIKESITHNSKNPNQKYFELKEPITFDSLDSIPKITYTHLYIRKPANDTPQRGDIDFYVDENTYIALKSVVTNNTIKNIRVTEQTGVGTLIELYKPEVNALAYISTKEMTEKIKVRHFV